MVWFGASLLVLVGLMAWLVAPRVVLFGFVLWRVREFLAVLVVLVGLAGLVCEFG